MRRAWVQSAFIDTEETTAFTLTVMPRRIQNLVKFQLERLLLRGAHMRLLVIAALIGLLSVGGGALVLWLDPGFQEPGEAVWWAFLRLSDPGYLGDDVGTARRVISATLTVLGYVVFLGALVAIMTQWLQKTMRLLESGLTPIAQSNHVLILGWTHRTPTIVRDLLLSGERVERFLSHRGARALRVVILAEEVSAELVAELRDKLGTAWREPRITFRSGSPLKVEHLRRVDFTNAAAILLPGGDIASGGPQAGDARAIKTLLSLSPHLLHDGGRKPPLVVAEIFDPNKAPLARRAFPGPLEVVESDALIGRLIAQTVRHHGAAEVYAEVLSHSDGSELYVRECPELADRPFGLLRERFPSAILLGLVRHDGERFRPILSPPSSFLVEAGDRLVLLADEYEDTEPEERPLSAAPPLDVPAGPARAAVPRTEGRARRVLVVGYSHKVPAVLREFDRYEGERFEIDLLSSLPEAQRRERLAREGFVPERISLRHLEGEWTLPATLARLAPETYDNVVIIASDRTESEEDSDARSLLGYLVLRDLLEGRAGGPSVLVELLDEENAQLFRDGHTEVLVTPVMLSHILAQVALRRELGEVFDELFGPGGSGVVLRSAKELGLGGQEVSFADVRHRVERGGEIALGVRRRAPAGSPRLLLNPGDPQRWTLADEDEVVVLTAPDARSQDAEEEKREAANKIREST